MAKAKKQVPFEVAERIGPFYVYALVDPTTEQIFYVGKGKGDRVSAHGRQAGLEPDRGESAKTAKIKEIRAGDHEPRVDIVRHGLTEAEALTIEAALIDCVPGLTNAIAGQHAADGRVPLGELISRYGATPLSGSPPVPAILIRLGDHYIEDRRELEEGVFREGHGWYPQISDGELYDATRAWWRIAADRIVRDDIHHAVAVAEGVTRAVYRIDKWLPRRGNRSGFSGTRVTSGRVFDYYVGPLGKRVAFPAHSQTSIYYWPRPT